MCVLIYRSLPVHDNIHERHTKRIQTLVIIDLAVILILYLSHNTHLAVNLTRLGIYALCSSWWPKKNKLCSLQRRGRIKERRVNVCYSNVLCQLLDHDSCM
ncbi:hypothetical protein BJX66DRAFT_318742, partial [Aspergillus keveii]